MDKTIKFALEDVEKYIDDTDPEMAIAKVDFLSTRPNAHHIIITEELLRRDASSILGKFLIGKMNTLETDTEGHEPKENIFGYFPQEQDIEFRKKDGYLVASAKAVISKLYANEYYNMFVNDNYRDVSVEMLSYGMVDKGDDKEIDGFNLTGCTTLGHFIKPSCPDANMSIIQFSEEKADAFYHEKTNDVNNLKSFAERRRIKLSENYENHPVDTSKKSVDMGDWDGNKAKKDLLKEKNFETVGKKVCLDFKGGDRILANCKYPVMNLKDGKWVYNAEGLSSARAYGEQHDESVANKAITIQKKLGLYKDDEKKGGNTKMGQEKFAVNIGDLWGLVYQSLETKYPDKTYGSIYRIFGIYEESNQKFVVIFKREETQMYRLDFDLDETTGLTLSEEVVAVEQKFIETDEVQKFEAPEDAEKFGKFEEVEDDEKDADDEEEKEEDAKMSSNVNVDAEAYEKMLEKEAEKNKVLSEQLEEKDNIIMGYETELADLRQFKSDCLEKEKMETVNGTLAKVKDKMTEDDYAKCEQSGQECKFEDVQAWKNGVLAQVAESVLFSKEEIKDSHLRMNIFGQDNDNAEKSLWDRL